MTNNYLLDRILEAESGKIGIPEKVPAFYPARHTGGLQGQTGGAAS